MYQKKTDKVYNKHKSFLARCRRKMKMSATTMAHTMGCSLTNLYDIEQRPLGRDLYTIKKYCAILGINWIVALRCLDLEYKPLDSKESVKDLYVMINGQIVRARDFKEDKGE